MVLYLAILVGIIAILFIDESLEEKNAQFNFVRLKQIALKVICTLTSTLLIVFFFSEVLHASEEQIDIIAAISMAMSYMLCAYIFRKK